MQDNHLDSLVVKYTLVACFVGVTLIFGGKVLALVWAHAKSGDLLRGLWEAVWNGGGR